MNSNRKFLYLLFPLFTLGCKNHNTQHYDQQVEVTFDTVPSDQNKTSVKIICMPYTEDLMTITLLD